MAQTIHIAPHAALLIDFDNVTLGIRSDLAKELRTLLGSDIIKGKVAVQRAYADWRRYPQYIMPLTEASIDLIFAPAFGTNKKNATDIRLAVDAIELLFTRPEIGTFILLSGDSDFSSLVIKLKEYGKYVIGVGIRESASDLLIQNCDEYFSYNDLAGLTREADAPATHRDAWELVGEAVAQMARNHDVMRSDRLKQVMQQIDPNFDEKDSGFNRFSKFVTEAGNRGLIRVLKLENGQFEVAPLAPGEAPAPRAAEHPRRGAPAVPPVAAAAAAGEPEENGRRRRGRRGGRGRGDRGGRVEREETATAAVPAAAAPPARRDGALTLAESFELLQRAMAELRTPVSHDKIRARMVALLGREDPLLDADRFGRLLRQANDAEVADVRKTGDDKFEISPHRSQRLAHAAAAAAAPAAERGEVAAPTGEPASPARPERKGRGDRRPRGHTARAEAPRESAPAPEPPTPPAPAPDPARRVVAGLRFRRGSRGPVRSADVPLVGVVKIEPDVVVREVRPKAEGRTKPKAEGRKPKAASRPKAEAGAPAKAAAAAEAGPKSPRRGARGRGRSKAAATAE
jgi:uncharacterized protein (TIGR00288 family)